MLPWWADLAILAIFPLFALPVLVTAIWLEREFIRKGEQEFSDRF